MTGVTGIIRKRILPSRIQHLQAGFYPKNTGPSARVDEEHLNSLGNKIVAQAVVDKLAACGFL